MKAAKKQQAKNTFIIKDTSETFNALTVSVAGGIKGKNEYYNINVSYDSGKDVERRMSLDVYGEFVCCAYEDVDHIIQTLQAFQKLHGPAGAAKEAALNKKK
jgi:hypothetical protein